MGEEEAILARQTTKGEPTREGGKERGREGGRARNVPDWWALTRRLFVTFIAYSFPV